MGFRWKDSVSGGINGFRAGSRFGPWGMVIGTVAGAAAGGYGKDIDKKVTGNSQSGMTSGLIETAGDIGSTGKGGSAAGMGGNLFDRFSGSDKTEEGYENNPAVLARKNNQNSSSSGGGGIMGMLGGGGGMGIDLGSLMGGTSQSSDGVKTSNSFNRRGSGYGYDSGGSRYNSGGNSGGGLDLNQIMQIYNLFSKSRSGSGSGSISFA